MKVLFIVPEVRLDSAPSNMPFWSGILGAIVKQKSVKVGILDFFCSVVSIFNDLFEKGFHLTKKVGIF